MTQNFFALVLLQGVNYLLPLITFPFLIRMLGVERWGLVGFGYTTMYYFVMLTDFGFNLSATKYISIHKHEPDVVNCYLNSAFVCRFFLAIACFLLLLLLTASIHMFRQDASFFICYFGIVVGNVMFPMWYFQGMEKMKYITVFNIVSKTVSCLPFFIFIRKPEDYSLVPIFYSMGFIIAGFISIYIIYFREKQKWFIPPFRKIKFAFTDSFTYFLSRISVSMYTYINTFVIGLACGNTAVGYYLAAEKLYQAYNNLLLPFTGVLFPHIAKTHNVPFFKRVLKFIVPANIVLLSGIMLGSYWLIWFICGDPLQTETLGVFRILMCASLVTIPSVLIGYPFLAAMGHARYTNWTLIGISFFHVAGLSLLYVYGSLSIYNVAIMVLLTESLVLAFRVGGIIKYKLFDETGNAIRH
ncbi:MAG: oligosaccharide flippase family protein [Tannerella sp.]|jgi:PST family polysaccharide transporter|nr:oligosaccharide flippase family protein [Tannerella sp.]